MNMTVNFMLFIIIFVLTLTQQVSSAANINDCVPMKKLLFGDNVPDSKEAPVPSNAPSASPPIDSYPWVCGTPSPNLPGLSDMCGISCKNYCVQIRPFMPFRTCMRSCNPCCMKLECVPRHLRTDIPCRKWNKIKIVIHGKPTNCPRRSPKPSL